MRSGVARRTQRNQVTKPRCSLLFTFSSTFPAPTPPPSLSLHCISFHEPDLGVGAWYEEVSLQTLLIAEVVEFFTHSLVGLALEYFRCDEAFEHSLASACYPGTTP
jgi:hypothetical protein